MDTERSLELLTRCETDLGRLTGVGSDAWHSCIRRTAAVLSRVLGPDHRLVNEFESIGWYRDFDRWLDSGVFGLSPIQPVARFEPARSEALGILAAARFEVEELAEPTDVLSDTAIDPELWAHVSHLAAQEQWSQVASQATIFLEDKMRTWAGLSAEAHGTDLATKVLRPKDGTFPLGITDSEKEGWHQFGRGIFGAARNVDGHRIQQRDDLKRYALGVLGASSLLLTQLRYQHGNSFQKP